MSHSQPANVMSLLTTHEAAALLGRSPRTVRRLVDEGQLGNAYPDLSATSRPRRYIDAQSVQVYRRAERLAATSPVNRHPALQPFALHTKVIDPFRRKDRALDLNLSVLELDTNLEVTYAINVVPTADEVEPQRWDLIPRLKALPDPAQLMDEAAGLLRDRMVLAYAHNDDHALALQAALTERGFRALVWPAVGPRYADAATPAAIERSEAARRLLRACMGVTCDVLIVTQPEPHFEDVEFDALILAAPQISAYHYALQFLPLIRTPTEHPALVVQVLFSGEQRRLFNTQAWQ